MGILSHRLELRAPTWSRGETLYVMLRPTQTRPTHSARTWRACWVVRRRAGATGVYILRRVLGHRPEVRAPTWRDAL